MADEQLPTLDLTDSSLARYSHVVDALLSTPWAILPAKLSAIVDLVVRRAEGIRLSPAELAQFKQPTFAAALYPVEAAGPRTPGVTSAQTIAVIPVMGTLLPRVGALDAMSGATSYLDLQRAIRAAVNDPDVRAVVLNIDSPGGAVALCQELADDIRAMRDSKPITAIANSTAASAAFWLGAQAGRLVVTPSGQVGSVGVVAAHDNIAARLEAEGVQKTVLATSKYKTEGNPYEPLTDEARAEAIRVLQAYHGEFERGLAKGRKVSAAQVHSQFGEGRMVLASEAVERGMADAVETFDDVLASFGARRRGGAKAEADAPAVVAQAAELSGGVLGAAIAARMGGLEREQAHDAQPEQVEGSA
ncbi:MAG: S49 family peptidase [Vicinamibacterales bacterium]